MVPELRKQTRSSTAGSTAETEQPVVSDEVVVFRNYDSTAVNAVRVRLLSVDNTVVMRQTTTVPPQSVVTIHEPLERGVYRVEAHIEGDSLDSADCLIGSGPDETALVELGNGIVSVVEGVL